MAGLALTYLDEACAGAFSDENLLAAMARFEAALARASAKSGLLPPEDAEAIARACASAKFDARTLGLQARTAGSLVVPFLEQLRKQTGAAARHLHAGATSQDVVDTAVVLCAGAAGSRILLLSRALGDALAELARRHAGTRCMARTLLQPALPVTFGWRVAAWLTTLARAHDGFARALHAASVVQFGGPEGTLSSFGAKAQAVEAALASELRLQVPPTSWHSARDGFARLGAEAAILGGAAAKIARDVALLMQPEIGELAEPAAPGRGGSSSMPHKRNPAGCLLALEASHRAPGLVSTLLASLTPELERGLGQWQSQWLTLRELLGGTGSALAAIGEVIAGLQVRVETMEKGLPAAGDDTGSRAMIERALSDWQGRRATERGTGP